MNSKSKSEFALLCSKYRKRIGLKQREAAEAIGLKYKTYCNVEYSPFVVIRRERALNLSNVFKLSGHERDDFIAAYDRVPLHPFSEKRREFWADRNAKRSKAKAYDRMRDLLFDLLDDLVFHEAKCSCVEGDFHTDAYQCAMCEAMRELGVSAGWVTYEAAGDAIAKLSPLSRRDRLAAKTA